MADEKNTPVPSSLKSSGKDAAKQRSNGSTEAPPANPQERGYTSVIAQIDEAGFIKTAAGRDAATQAPVAPAPAVTVAPVAPSIPVSTLQLNKGDEATLEVLSHRLDEYIQAMDKGVPMKPATGAAWQRKLFAVIDQTLKLSGPTFNKGWSNLLAKVAAHRKGAFHETYAFRFFEQLGLERPAITSYRNLLHLIVHTADPKSRQHMLRMIDINSVTRGLHIPDAADKLYGYYHL